MEKRLVSVKLNERIGGPGNWGGSSYFSILATKAGKVAPEPMF
ncbi:hypothetical protein [Pontibacillus yanchengensis]|nr:hypothetical protein [Pontibacillus yanchengensis]